MNRYKAIYFDIDDNKRTFTVTALDFDEAVAKARTWIATNDASGSLFNVVKYKMPSRKSED